MVAVRVSVLLLIAATVRHTSDYASWIAHGDTMGRNVLGDNVVPTNNIMMSDTNAGQD